MVTREPLSQLMNWIQKVSAHERRTSDERPAIVEFACFKVGETLHQWETMLQETAVQSVWGALMEECGVGQWGPSSG